MGDDNDGMRSFDGTYSWKAMHEKNNDFVEQVYEQLCAELEKNGSNIHELEAKMLRHANDRANELLAELDQEEQFMVERILCYALFSAVAARVEPRDAPREAVWIAAMHHLGVRPPADA